MASGQSGNDHAQTPPKAESLRFPVFWLHLPQTWVSFFFFFPFFFLLLYYLLLHARAVPPPLTCANLCEIQCVTLDRFTGKHRLPPDLTPKHDQKVSISADMFYKYSRRYTQQSLCSRGTRCA